MSRGETILHEAMCQAVSQMNLSVKVLTSEEGRAAHDVLRKALIDYADYATTAQQPVGVMLRRVNMETKEQKVGPELYREFKDLPVHTLLYQEPNGDPFPHYHMLCDGLAELDRVARSFFDPEKGNTEKMAESHPSLICRQMASEIVRLRKQLKEATEPRVNRVVSLCKRHEGFQFTMKVGYSPPSIPFCPLCEDDPHKSE